MKTSQVILITAVPLAFGLGLLLRIPSCSEQQRRDGLVEDSAVIREKQWRDEEGRLHTEIKALQAESAKDFLKMKYQDSMLQELQKTVREYRKKLKHGGAVVQFKERVVYRNVVDTSKFDSLRRVYRKKPWDCFIAESIAFIKDGKGWGMVQVQGRNGCLQARVIMDNEYRMVLSRKPHWFKPDEYHVELENANPFIIESKRTVRYLQLDKSMRRKHFGIGPMVGVGLGYDLKVHPIIGVGLQWNVIQF
nr:MAG TPA: hypothetical protein [Caudoviricetes sp.]